MQSEIVEGLMPTTADSWTDIGTFTVPAGVKSLKRVTLSHAPDPSITGGTASSIRFAVAVRLIGSGLLEQSPHEYLGQFGQILYGSGATNFNQAIFTLGRLVEEYDVDIPVQVGGTIQVQAILLDEAGINGAIIVELVYSEEAAKATNSMSQFVDSAGAVAADTYTIVGTITVPQLAKAPKKIREIVFAVAPDVGTGAVSMRIGSVFRLTGAGIAEGGRHDYAGPGGHFQTVAAGGTGLPGAGGSIVLIKRKKIDVPVNPGGQILVEQMYVDEYPAASTVAVCLLYE